MRNQASIIGIQPGQTFWIVIFFPLALTFLLIIFTANNALASIQNSNTQGRRFLALQSTPTPTPTPQIEVTSTYTFSLATLGYNETTLDSPSDGAEFSFRLPENWSIQTDGLLELDFSYTYSQVETDYPALFGSLTVKLDDQTLNVFPIEERDLNNYQLRIPLPSALLSSTRTRHVLSLEFDAGVLCEVPHQAKLIVHSTSSVLINYNQNSLEFDLSRYPWPFYQQAFDPDVVYFALPSRPTPNDIVNALGVAAKLGDLTGNRIVISPTTDLDLGQIISPVSATFDEHLIVIGSPQDNKLLPLLNNIVQLPVSLHQRQLEVAVQGPTIVAPSDTFTYTFNITNTTNQRADLSLLDSLPLHTTLIKCVPDCSKNTDDNIITWSNLELSPDASLHLSLVLKAGDSIIEEIENTVTVYEADLGPINANTLTSTVVTDSSGSELQVSVADQNGYFFIYNDRAVAEGDGIIQEIISPWNENRAILIITGLTHEAVQKASQAMSSETRFPGMNTTVALVRKALSLPEINQTDTPQVEMTLADLGYPDRFLRGQSQQLVEYYFTVPFGWQLSDEAAIDLYFYHSQLMDYQESGLTVSLNRQPVASVVLNDETASDGHLRIKLKDTNIQPGQNRLSVQVNLSLPGQCIDPASDQIWFVIKSTSRISLAHDEAPGLLLDLDYFPIPFQTNQSLSNLLFALPDDPTLDEWGTTLRLAASLGSSAAGKTLIPAATFGSDLPGKVLANYQILAIGRPSRNTLIQEVNSQLPQPFLPGSDEIKQQLDDVIFRLAPDIDLGYIQLLASPWNQEQAFLAVTGTTNEGVKQAVSTLASRPWTLKGNLALVRDNRVNTIDTRGLTSSGITMALATAMPVMTPVATATTVPTLSLPVTPDLNRAGSTPSVSTPERASAPGATLPSWLIPLVGLNGLLVIIIFGFVFWQARRKRL
ncbi:MAG: hypothetical protein BroJett011_57600 [Chloroflexota bacterium]|nr:MAG: hypothetical protein BroJett011_57600 [Chloroflexota bacterium]